jgi:peptide/nickel transport system permease protein
MTQYVVRRLLLMVPVLWGVGTFVFILVRLLPGDAITTLLEDSQNVSDVEAMKRELGLDEPLPLQYIQWMGNAVRFDFGNSLLSRRPVLTELRRTLPVSAELAVLAVVVTILVAVPGGALAAAKQDSIWDYLARAFAVAFLATPSFWLATMALVLPAYWWGWVPPLQYRPLFEDPTTNLRQFLLPGLILGISSAAVSLRMMRSQMLEVLRQDYIRTAWAKGLVRRRIMIRHALRNALIPVVTLFGNEFGRLIGGTVIIETIFGLPGVGRYFVEGALNRDYTLVMGTVVLVAVFVLLFNLLVDIAYALIDPRVRHD